MVILNADEVRHCLFWVQEFTCYFQILCPWDMTSWFTVPQKYLYIITAHQILMWMATNDTENNLSALLRGWTSQGWGQWWWWWLVFILRSDENEFSEDTFKKKSNHFINLTEPFFFFSFFFFFRKWAMPISTRTQMKSTHQATGGLRLTKRHMYPGSGKCAWIHNSLGNRPPPPSTHTKSLLSSMREITRRQVHSLGCVRMTHRAWAMLPTCPGRGRL